MTEQADRQGVLRQSGAARTACIGYALLRASAQCGQSMGVRIAAAAAEATKLPAYTELEYLRTCTSPRYIRRRCRSRTAYCMIGKSKGARKRERERHARRITARHIAAHEADMDADDGPLYDGFDE